jgi:uncharacterized protein (TIGR00369 family)
MATRTVRITDAPVDVVHTVGFDWIDVRSDGSSRISWSDPAGYTIPTPAGAVVHGGMITMFADAAMAWAVYGLEHPPEFLTGDLRCEFLRAAPAGPLIAEGWVVRRTRRVVFAAAEVRSVDDQVVYAAARATQVVLGDRSRVSVTGLWDPPATGPYG